ncbi:MAG: hypothetical protein HS111_03680 [Kofleriaceae bacterium]|nr:hypothetical protein [Kofleriaceae bacterium]
MSRALRVEERIDREWNPEALAVVEQAMEALALFRRQTPSPSLAAEVRWFSSTGSVVVRGSRSSVFVGGLLLGGVR